MAVAAVEPLGVTVSDLKWSDQTEMSPAEKKTIDPRIQSLLGGLRWRIRVYVWLEGICLACIWLGITFWAGLALDYLPVLAGASEMPRAARAVILLAIVVVLAYILYHWVLRRTFVRLADRSMAVLLERRYRGFHDSLVTSVEMTEHPDHAETFREDMLEQTGEEALTGIEDVRLRQVFSFGPLLRSLSGALVFAVTILAFYLVYDQAMATWVNRIYLLKDEPWPRMARIEVVGVELLAAEEVAERVVETPFIPFENNRLKVAKGSNLRLRVRADRSAYAVPDVCTIHYRTEDGERGRVNMNRSRSPRGGYQDFSFTGKPLRGILSTVAFDVVGKDYRVRDHVIEVVDSPSVVAVELDCTFPPYMVDEQLSQWLPRTVELTNATQLPIGTDIKIRARTNKSLRRVDLYNVDTKEVTTLDIDGEADAASAFEYHVPSLDANLTLDVTLYDTDKVVTERPYRIFIAAIPDEEPAVNVHLVGIGTAVTPDVIIPVKGKVIDDYAVQEVWFDTEIIRGGAGSNKAGRGERQVHPFSLKQGGVVDGSIDFRELRSQDEPYELKAQDRLMLAIQASDKYDLSGNPNIGTGDRYQLDVVTPEELLVMLEAREIGLRRRFEQIIEEMTQARDFLSRVQSPASSRGAEPGDQPADGADPGDAEEEEARAAERAQSLRLLRVQQSLQQARKSEQELLGVATSFLDIRGELINNRIDTEDRKKRLKDLIADPMQLIAEAMFPELERRLEVLEKVLLNDLGAKRYDLETGADESTSSLEQANDILAELDEILQQMLDLETYNELLDIVRQLINDQEKLIEETTTEKSRGGLQHLLDN